ncbi:MAG: hypothetical protein IPP79_21200 [Chitinophagaceae bacterium]|nr:hypothetical protein [Chitinophagaceae bacterium]
MDSDTLFSDAEDLVAEFKKNIDGSFILDPKNEFVVNERDSSDGLFTIRYYKPRIEGLFARIERWTEKYRKNKMACYYQGKYHYPFWLD